MSPNRAGVSRTSAATVRNVSTVDPAVRAVTAENPSPIPHTDARITATTTTTRSTARPGVPPSASATPKKGRLATRNAHAAAHAASSLPAVISAGVSSVTCSVASVPALRSPLMPVDASVGVTSRPRPSTRNVTAANRSGPFDVWLSGVPWLDAIVESAPDASSVIAPTTTNHTTSATTHRVERTR